MAMYTVHRESKDVPTGLRPEKKYTPRNRSTGTRQPMFLCDPRNIAMRCAVFLLSMLSCWATDLEHRIDALADASGPVSQAFVGIHVVELATGKTLYHRNEDKLFLPASNMKLFSTALALLR